MNKEITDFESKFKNIISIVKKNSKLLITIVSVALLGLITILYLNYKNQKDLIHISEQYYKAQILIEKKNNNQAKLILENIIAKKSKLYSPLSLYLIIDLKLESNSLKVIELFDEVLKIKKIGKEDRNLIKIKKALYISNNNDEEQIILDLLNPIVNSNSIWRKMSIEFLAKYFSNKNQKVKSEDYYKLLNNR
tara:strand:+ start:231 stop:809 length:579 start_codon:yes stop_codon:yes gene_type:complete